MMLVQRCVFVFTFLVSSCAVASDSNAIRIGNQLSACTAITNTEISAESGIPVLLFDLRVNKPIAECGCKSALASYAVYASTDEYMSYILGGKIGFMASARKLLPLSAEQKLINKRELVIEFSCARPD